MRPIDEWDQAYVLSEVQNAQESEKFERKASVALSDRESLAKEICAFANAGEGTLVFGLMDGGGLDAGVDEHVGREPVQSWAEKVIPTLHYPPVTNCQVRFLPISDLGSRRGILAIRVPLSDKRPHWSVSGGHDVPYLRVGEHSDRMRLQTLLDISSRGVAPSIEIGDLHLEASGDIRQSTNIVHPIWIFAGVRVCSGQICHVWGVEITLATDNPDDMLLDVKDPGGARKQNGRQTYFAQGAEPLFPGRWTRSQPVNLLLQPTSRQRIVSVVLFVESALAVRSAWRINECDLADLGFSTTQIVSNEPGL
jgi:hypothetical protein